MNRRRFKQDEDARYRDAFTDLHARGAQDFGLLWLKVNEEAVGAFRRHGFGDELERRGRLASALSESLFKALLHAKQAAASGNINGR